MIIRVGSPKSKKRNSEEKTALYLNVVACADKLADGADLSEIFNDYDTGTAYLRHPKVVKELTDARRKAAQKEKALKKNWETQCFAGGKKDSSRKPSANRTTAKSSGTTTQSETREKTYMSKLLIHKHGAVRFENVKTTDIKHAYKGERIVIFDLSRSQQGVLNYEIIRVHQKRNNVFRQVREQHENARHLTRDHFRQLVTGPHQIKRGQVGRTADGRQRPSLNRTTQRHSYTIIKKEKEDQAAAVSHPLTIDSFDDDDLFHDISIYTPPPNVYHDDGDDDDFA